MQSVAEAIRRIDGENLSALVSSAWEEMGRDGCHEDLPAMAAGLDAPQLQDILEVMMSSAAGLRGSARRGLALRVVLQQGADVNELVGAQQVRTLRV